MEMKKSSEDFSECKSEDIDILRQELEESEKPNSGNEIIDNIVEELTITKKDDNILAPDFDYLKRLIEEDVEDKALGWNKAINDKMHKVYAKKCSDKPVVLVKVYAKISKVNLDQLFKLIIDCEDRKQWDKIIKDLYVSEKIDSNSDIIYCEIKTPPGFSNRDYVQYRYFLHNKRDAPLIEKFNLFKRDNLNYYVLYLKSVERDNLPLKKGLVRAETIITGYLIEEDPENIEDIKFTMVLQTDVKGNIPISIFNKVSTRVPGMWIKNLITGYQEKYEKNNEKDKK